MMMRRLFFSHMRPRGVRVVAPNQLILSRQLSLHSPMFPERPQPVIDIHNTKAANEEDDSFLSRHGGKVALVGFAFAIGLVYRWFRNGWNRTDMEKEIERKRIMDPLEAADFSRSNSMTM